VASREACISSDCLPVVRQERVVGIASRANLLHAPASVVGDLPASPATDTTIREQITSEFSRKAWSPRDFNVLVRDGVVEFWGTILDERERQAAKVAVENVGGVKAVKDHLVWTEPRGGMVFASRSADTNWAVSSSNTMGRFWTLRAFGGPTPAIFFVSERPIADGIGSTILQAANGSGQRSMALSLTNHALDAPKLCRFLVRGISASLAVPPTVGNFVSVVRAASEGAVTAAIRIPSAP